jgi:hypothetical protein
MPLNGLQQESSRLSLRETAMRICRLLWGRIITGVVAGIMLLLAIPLFFTGAEIRRRADEARTTELLRLKADLSKPDAYSGTFTYRFTAAHGGCIQLLTVPPRTSFEEARGMLDGIRGNLVITRLSDGITYWKQEIAPAHFEYLRTDSETLVPVLRFHCNTEADYEMKLLIDTGAVRLAGIPQTLSVRYEICGLEYMPAALASLLGIVGCTIAGILILVTVVVTVAKRARTGREQPPSP